MIKKYKWKAGIPDKHIHVMNPILSQFTLCRDSFDVDETDENVPIGKGGLVETDDSINCPRCLSVIKFCKRINDLPKL